MRSLSADNNLLAHLSKTDALTSLANRRVLTDKLADFDIALARGDRLSVILIDIDYFKMYNDTHGHAAGDECLRRVASVFGPDRQDIGLAVRFGGEEFVIVAHGEAASRTKILAERLRRDIQDLAILHKGRSDGLSVVTISLGYAEGCADTTAGELIDRADAALYKAKRLGRNRSCSIDTDGTSSCGEKHVDETPPARTSRSRRAA